MMSFGYVKDAIASCIFIAVLLVLFFLHDKRITSPGSVMRPMPLFLYFLMRFI